MCFKTALCACHISTLSLSLSGGGMQSVMTALKTLTLSTAFIAIIGGVVGNHGTLYSHELLSDKQSQPLIAAISLTGTQCYSQKPQLSFCTIIIISVTHLFVIREEVYGC